MSRIRAAHSPNNQATGGNKAGQTEEAVNSINSQSLSCSQPSHQTVVDLQLVQCGCARDTKPKLEN